MWGKASARRTPDAATTYGVLSISLGHHLPSSLDNYSKAEVDTELLLPKNAIQWDLRENGSALVLQRHVRQLSMAQVIIFQELKSFLRISIRTWLMDQNPCETSHFLAIGVLTQR